MALEDVTTTRGRQLEGPKEVGDCLEIWACCIELMNHILNAMDTILAELLGDDLVVRQRDAILVHLAKAALVHELADGLQRWVAIGDVRLDALQHVDDWCVDLQEHSIADLAKTQQLENLPWLWGNLVNTMDADDKKQLCLWLDEEIVLAFGLPPKGNELLFSPGIFLVVSQSADLQFATTVRILLLLFSKSAGLLVGQFRVPRNLLLQTFRDFCRCRCAVDWDQIPFSHLTGWKTTKLTL